MGIQVKNKDINPKVREVLGKKGRFFRNNPEEQGSAGPVHGGGPKVRRIFSETSLIA
jgi:hypothetical protein